MTAEADRVDAVTQITDHEARAVAELMEKLRGKTNIEAIVRAWAIELQALEDAAWATLMQADLESAEGVQLDQIGELLQLGRGSLNDVAYRAVLRAIVRARISSGTGPDILAVAALALDSTDFSVRFGHASALVEPHAPIGFDASAVLTVLLIAKMGGVQLQLFDPPAPESALFTFTASRILPTADSARGWGDDADDDMGGRLSGVVA